MRGPALTIVGVVAGAMTAATVRRAPEYAIAGGSVLFLAVGLAAGGALLAAGVIALRRPARRSFGVLAVLASWAWFGGQWNTPGAGSAWAFTTGLVFAGVAPVLVADAAMRYPGRRLGVVAAVALAAGYLCTVGLAGVLPALFFDPAMAGCYGCPANLLLVDGRPEVVETASRVAVRAGVVWPALLAGVLAWRLARSSGPMRRVAAPVAVPVMVLLVVVGLDFVHSWRRGYLGTDEVDRGLWAVQAGLLIVAALGTGWSFVRRRRTRSAVARMVVAASEASEPGGLERTLGAALGDDSLRVLYPAGDGWMDAEGRPAGLDGRGTTRLTRDGTTIALLTHRREVLDEDDVVDEVAGAAGLALSNERLHAQRQAQLADLRASRARIVAAADAERRRLERDLHDGAQQRIVALALALRLEQMRSDETDALARAQEEVAATLAALRKVARGLYPRELADEGLFAALETLAETADLTVEAPADERFPAAVEAVAYFAVAHRLAIAEGARAAVSVRREGDRVRVEIEDDGPAGETLPLEDRVGALAGTLSVEASPDGGTRIRAELPCGS